MVRQNRAVLATALAATVILSAPFAQQAAEGLLARSPDVFRSTSLAATLTPIGLLLVAALLRIREQRPTRYLALIVAVALGAGYAALAGLTAGEGFHFVEYGLVALMFYSAYRGTADRSMFVIPVLAVILAGTLDEWFQWFVPVRTGEARDVLLNAVAGVCGTAFGIAIEPPARVATAWRRSAAPGIRVWAVVTAVTFAAFVSSVHVGYDIRDAAAGLFRSRYTAPELAAIGAERAVRWRSDPPIVQRRMWREDQYLTEGLVHVRHRNDLLGTDPAAAWRENLILETYYGPVLDTPSYASPIGSRWPATQRAGVEQARVDQARVERAAASPGGVYVSAAYPYPMYAFPGGALSTLLILKVVLVPGLVAAITLAVRAWGPAAGGWLSALPLVAGPVLAFYAVEQGTEFAANAARGTMAGLAAIVAFAVGYSRLCRRFPWYVSLAGGWSLFALCTLTLLAWRPGLLISAMLPLVAVMAGRAMMPPVERVDAGGPAPRGDLVVRLLASATLVLVLTSTAERLGPTMSGLLIAFPVLTTTVAAFTQVQRGHAAVIAFFHGFLPGLIGFGLFCFVLSVALVPWGLAYALLAAVAVQLCLHAIVRRPFRAREALDAGAAAATDAAAEAAGAGKMGTV